MALTEEQLRGVARDLKGAIDEERSYLEPVLRALGEGHVEMRNDLDDVARKLVDVTAALVAADGALAQRIDRIEEGLWPTPDQFEGNIGANIAGGRYARRRGLLSRVTRRTRTHARAVPEGDE